MKKIRSRRRKMTNCCGRGRNQRLFKTSEGAVSKQIQRMTLHFLQLLPCPASVTDATSLLANPSFLRRRFFRDVSTISIVFLWPWNSKTMFTWPDHCITVLAPSLNPPWIPQCLDLRSQSKSSEGFSQIHLIETTTYTVANWSGLIQCQTK